MGSDYEPDRYWSDRLETNFSLRGTGHRAYSKAYNAWLYRAKAKALDRALDHAASSGIALDVGSGTGWCVERLLKRGFDVVGCDITAKSVETLGRVYPSASFHRVHAGVDRFPGSDGEIAVVTALDVLYHVKSDEEWRFCLDEAHRVLAPSGAFIVTDAFGESDLDPAGHVRFRSEARWREAAGQARMTVEHAIPLYRWLSRDRGASALDRLPDNARGAIEYGLERIAPKTPHMWLLVLRAEP